MLISEEEMLHNFRVEFELKIAATEQLKKEAYRIRYQVYCEDLKYEDANEFPDEMETDRHDEKSISLLLHHKPSNAFVGCVRLVPSTPEKPTLPFEEIPDINISSDIVDISKLPRKHMFEVSRLAVVSDFRKHSEGKQSPQKGFPIVPLSLYLGVLGVMCETGLEHLFTMMEPRLARHLKYVGFYFHQIGDLVNYHGRRGPFYIHRDGKDGLHPTYCLLQKLIQEELKEPLLKLPKQCNTSL